MKHSRWVIVLAALATPIAQAGPVTPPTGWTADGELAVKLTKAGSSVPHFGGLPSIVTTEVHRSGTATLFVHRVSAGIAGATAPMRDRAATIELQELPAAAKRAGSAVRLDPAPKLGPSGKRLEGSLGWIDDTTAVISMHHMVVAADEQQLVAVHGECVMPPGEAALRKACGDALLSLDPGIAPDRQVALSLIELPPDPPAGSASRAPSLIESGERPSLPPMQIPQEPRETDRRPVYVGLGLIVLAAIFYWNRKNREKLERDYEKRTADKPAAQQDHDADDLHAAASSGGKDTKEPEA